MNGAGWSSVASMCRKCLKKTSGGGQGPPASRLATTIIHAPFIPHRCGLDSVLLDSAVRRNDQPAVLPSPTMSAAK